MLQEHRRIVAAIAAGDPAAAERAMRAHVRAGRDELRRVHLSGGDGGAVRRPAGRA
jgi:DNA-binding FadR family transcriptional regulator